MNQLTILLFFSHSISVNADDDAATANSFVDSVVEALKKKDNFDPMEIGEEHAEVKEKVGLLNVGAKVDLHQIKLTGLSRALRVGNAEMVNQNGAFNAKLQLGDNDVKLNADLTIHLGKQIHPDLKLDADIGHMLVTFGIQYDSAGKPSVSEFKIDQLKNMKVKVHSKISIIDPVLDELVQIATKVLNKLVLDIVTQVVKPALSDQMTKLLGGSGNN